MDFLKVGNRSLYLINGLETILPSENMHGQGRLTARASGAVEQDPEI